MKRERKKNRHLIRFDHREDHLLQLNYNKITPNKIFYCYFIISIRVFIKNSINKKRKLRVNPQFFNSKLYSK